MSATELNAGYLEHLYRICESRKDAPASESYIASLYAKGHLKIAQKVGEEGVETAIAASVRDRVGTINESADLLFHLLILLAEAGIPLADVLAEMHRREGVSGLSEKLARNH